MHSTDSAALDPALIDDLVDDIVASAPCDAEAMEKRRRMARLALLAARPADLMAAVLVVQALVAHYAAMDAFRQAALAQDEKLAARLRTNAALLARTMRTNLKTADARREPLEPRSPSRAARASGTPTPVIAPSAAVPAPAAPPRWETLTMEQRRAAYGYVHEGEAAAGV